MALRVALLAALVAAASAFTAPAAMKPMSLRSSAFCPAAPMTARAPAAKSGMRMGLEQITDTDGSPLDLVKGFAFFGASFVPSFFLAAYFLGGYYPPLALGANTEPSWWPTAMQYANGIPMGTLAENVKKVEVKEKAAAEAKAKVEAAKKAAKKAAKAAKAAAEAAKAQ